mmetsp:Transcript_14122/g.21969  ORF Transcript_14122/g.21969 Transcript_14122/m.21969 type:complete len:196 (+) Transcript_14122:305-892(+)
MAEGPAANNDGVESYRRVGIDVLGKEEAELLFPEPLLPFGALEAFKLDSAMGGNDEVGDIGDPQFGANLAFYSSERGQESGNSAHPQENDTVKETSKGRETCSHRKPFELDEGGVRSRVGVRASLSTKADHAPEEDLMHSLRRFDDSDSHVLRLQQMLDNTKLRHQKGAYPIDQPRPDHCPEVSDQGLGQYRFDV